MMYDFVVLTTQIRINTVNNGGRITASPRNTAARKAARRGCEKLAAGFAYRP